jgi:AsmA protein
VTATATPTRRVARWILGIAGAVVLLVVAAALIATMLVNPDHYKGRIETAVRRETGRPFVLDGHLQVTWFPWLGVHTGAARLGNPPGAVGPDLLDWQSADLRVRLLPLLHHRLEIGRIRLTGADIHLRRAAGGADNWDDLIARLRSGAPAGAAAGATTPGSPASPASTITWAGLDLENGSLDYVDEESGEHIALAGWQLSVGPWRAAEPLSVSTSFQLHADTLGVHGSTRATGAGAGALRLPPAGVHLSLEIAGLQIETSRAGPLEISAPRWTLGVADAKLEGAIEAGRDAAGQLTAGGSLTAALPSLRELAHTLGVGMPELEDPAALQALHLSGSWSYRAGALAIEPLTARLDSTTVTGWMKYDRSWTFALHGDQIDFGRYLTRGREQKPLELPVDALRALHVQGTVELERAQINGTTLKDVRLQVE